MFTKQDRAVFPNLHCFAGTTEKPRKAEPAGELDAEKQAQVTPMLCFQNMVNAMKKATKLRLLGGFILLFNLWLIGNYNLEGMLALLLTFGFAVGYEYIVVRPVSKAEKATHTNSN